MASKRDYYDVLGVARGASEKEIKAAYRRLARKHHPDLNRGDKGAEGRFKELVEAFAVLSDPEKRARYDRGGLGALGGEFDPFAGVDATRFDFGAGPGNLEDLLSQLFGGAFGGAARGRAGAGRRARGRGGDLRFETTISFADALRGTTVEIQVPRLVSCSTCEGRGTGPRGGVCRTCGGSGRTSVEERVKVRIPAGVDEGSTVRVPARGDAGGAGAPPGDLLLTLRVTPHERFKRNGRDLVCDVPIGIVRATLGGPVEVPTLDGRATIQVPAGTQSGTTLRVRGKGAPPGPRGEPGGDLYVVIQIRPPARIDERSRALLEELGRLHPEPVS